MGGLGGLVCVVGSFGGGGEDGVREARTGDGFGGLAIVVVDTRCWCGGGVDENR